ncbi:unnamed protein product [Arctogadus glacialis]
MVKVRESTGVKGNHRSTAGVVETRHAMQTINPSRSPTRRQRNNAPDLATKNPLADDAMADMDDFQIPAIEPFTGSIDEGEHHETSDLKSMRRTKNNTRDERRHKGDDRSRRTSSLIEDTNGRSPAIDEPDTPLTGS